MRPQFTPPPDARPVIWDLKTGNEAFRLPYSKERAVSADGGTLAFSFGNSVHVWDVASQKTIAEFHDNNAKIGAMTLSANGKFLAAKRTTSVPGFKGIMAGMDLTSKTHSDLVYWDVAARKELGAWHTDLDYFTLSADGKWISTMDRLSRIQVRDVVSGARRRLDSRQLADCLHTENQLPELRASNSLRTAHCCVEIATTVSGNSTSIKDYACVVIRKADVAMTTLI